MLLLLPLLEPFLCLMRGLVWFGGVRLKNKITPIVCDGILEERLTKDKKKLIMQLHLQTDVSTRYFSFILYNNISD